MTTGNAPTTKFAPLNFCFYCQCITHLTMTDFQVGNTSTVKQIVGNTLTVKNNIYDFQVGNTPTVKKIVGNTLTVKKIMIFKWVIH